MKTNDKVYKHGDKTSIAKSKELAARRLMKGGLSESDAIACVACWGEPDPRKWVIAKTSNHTLLRKVENGIVMWHPYIEKAKLFDSWYEADDFARSIDWRRNGYDDERDFNVSWEKTPSDVVIASVMDLTVPSRYHDTACYPFRAKTGIKAQIGMK